MECGTQRPYEAFDERHQAFVHEYTSVGSIALRGDDRQRVTLSAGQDSFLPIEGLLIPRKSRILLVALHGAIGPEIERPRFQYLRGLGHRTESQLFLADPTLTACPGLRLGWYVGTESSPMPHALAQYIDRVRKIVNAETVVLFGHSGGGFAALSLGHHLENSIAVSFNGQTRIASYARWAAEAFRESAFPSTTRLSDLEDRHGALVDLAELYSEQGADNSQMVAYQTESDRLHYEEHWLYLAKRLKTGGLSDSTSDRFTFLKGRWGSGHAGPETSMLSDLLTLAIERA